MCLKIDQMKNGNGLNIPLGVNENGEQEFLYLNKARNVLVAGRSGSGKSAFLHKAIKCLIENYSNKDVRLFLIDLKQTEFSTYKNAKNLYKKVATDWGSAIFPLYDILDEIGEREEKFLKLKVKNIDKYNELVSSKEKLPHIVIIIDEALEFLRENTEGGHVLKWLACNSTSLGVHLIISTQRANMVFPELKANLQTRVCFQVADSEDSLYVIHEEGAEKLKTGEFFYKSPNCNKITKYKIEV